MVSEDLIAFPNVRYPKIPVQYEFLIRAVPALLFILLAIARYFKTKQIGFVKTLVLTPFFKVQWTLQYFQAILELVMVAAFVLDYAYAPGVQSKSFKETALWSIVAIFNIGAWIASGKLLYYDYRKRLSEGRSTHKLFWVSNFVIDAVLTILSFRDYVRLRILIIVRTNGI